MEDVVQEVFLAALTHCRQLPQPVEPRNLADGDHAEQVPQPPATLAGRIEAVRSKSARGRVGRHRPTVARRARPGRDVSVRRAVQSLPHKDREAIVLRYFENLSAAEIAALTGASAAPVECGCTGRVATGGPPSPAGRRGAVMTPH